MELTTPAHSADISSALDIESILTKPLDIRATSVLVVDDDSTTRSVIVMMLRKLGIDIIWQAVDGIQALDVLQVEKGRDNPLDLVICDIEMPDLDGIEFMRIASEQGLAKSLLLLSGKSESILRGATLIAKEYGLMLVGALQKPPTMSMLSDALTKHKDLAKLKPLKQTTKFSKEDLLAGLDKGQFEPFFQPKVNIKSGDVSGCEALARWRNPELGILPPSMFIDELERYGLMDRLTWAVINQAVQWCKHWRMQGWGLSVSVNLSMSSLEDTRLSDRISDAVKAIGLVPEDLILEITESLAMTNIAYSMETLVRLRMKGFGLSIDDFGTGYSSLQQLERVPYTELKIDRGFVDGASKDPRLRAVLESGNSIAHKLGLSSVAEGVENVEDWQCIRDAGSDLAQGYFIARPMDGASFLKWLTQWQADPCAHLKALLIRRPKD
ncbi:MAG: EAL domain-containing protein (putative c-di-GMP-specific phosphodiesterase class I)/AmiR [Gammaproteobacteria bacterium]|jgi:EAL domain-containing protein (putative c-di-GMP-specific phosphodiesterase class I)/AmiR/NasT family two-component response regulator